MRPFKVLGIQQIAIGAPSKANLRHLWVDLFGLEQTGTFRSDKENVDEDILSIAGIEIDLMEPIDHSRSPKVDQPRLNHIGLWVDNLPACVEWLAAQGVRFTPGGIRKGAAGHDVCFIHPKGDGTSPLSGEGVLIELVQAPPDVITKLGGAP
jgi:lactoylglutathione lyase